MVEGAALEKQYIGNGIEGSNPSLSAKDVQFQKKAKELGVRPVHLIYEHTDTNELMLAWPFLVSVVVPMVALQYKGTSKGMEVQEKTPKSSSLGCQLTVLEISA